MLVGGLCSPRPAPVVEGRAVFALFPMVGACFLPVLGGPVLEAGGLAGSLFQGRKLLIGGLNSQSWGGKDQPVGCVAEGAAACTCLSVRSRYSVPGK